MIFFFQAEDGIRDGHVTGVQTCALPISLVVVTQCVGVEGAVIGAPPHGGMFTREGLHRLRESRAVEIVGHGRRRQMVSFPRSFSFCWHARGRSATENMPKPDRKSTRLNSSHVAISYAVFCLK